MDFSQFVASGARALAEGAIVERVRRDPSLPFDPHILNGGLIYDPAGRARLAAIHTDYIGAARRELSALPPAERAPVQPWLDKLTARDAALAASQKFVADTVAALSAPTISRQ